MNASKRLRRSCAYRAAGFVVSSPNQPRSAMTLIELLVVIVILTTLVGGVIPVISPNNDTRKIREATRGLQTYIMMAQAEAARTGRPHGVSFTESTAGSGIALEVSHLKVPPPFAGFSSQSRVVATIVDDSQTRYLYGNVSRGNDGRRFVGQYNGHRLYALQFVSTIKDASGKNLPDLFPPRMLRVGDKLEIDGNTFLIVDYGNDKSYPNKIEVINDIEYLVPQINVANPEPTYCILLNSTGQLPPQNLKRYQFNRLPVKSAEAPYQMPSSIGLDMQASVVEGSDTDGFPTESSLHIHIDNRFRDANDNPIPDTFGILFSPRGGIERVIFNGQSLARPSRIALLMGRIENGGLTSSSEWAMDNNMSLDDLKEFQEKINWLNLDSRWLSIAVNSGRTVVTENGFVNPDNLASDGENPTKLKSKSKLLMPLRTRCDKEVADDFAK